ncbi:MAG: response regulator [Leptolyngbya sp. PLA1]|nr:response regulator [Leptolyngbya sp. PLA1]
MPLVFGAPRQMHALPAADMHQSMLASRSILVCDDEAPIRHVIAHRLRTGGFTVREARTGLEGLKAITGPEAFRPQLIITDYQMPEMSGIEMAALLRKFDATASTPVLMLTARGYTLTPDELATTNIRHIISKPFGVRLLLDRVQELLDAPPPRLAA